MSNFNQFQNDRAAHAAAVEATPPTTAIPPVGTITGAAYAAQAGDDTRFIRLNNASPVAFTVPSNATVPFPIGAELSGSQAGAGAIAFAGGAGVTINSRGGLLSTAGQYAAFMLKKVATDTWLLIGDLA